MSRISRRGAISGIGALAVSSAGASRQTLKAADRRPNYLFIMADDLGYADLSCYGRRDYQTPQIDRLANQGIRFTQAYANSAVCSATRTALITGRYQYRLPIGLEEPLAVRDVGLPPALATLPSMLRIAGYRTSLIGKWHLGALPRFGPLQSGYDEFWGFRSGGVDYFTHANPAHHDLWDGDTEIHRVGYLTDLLGDRAVDQLGTYAKAARPFLMSLHFSAPHWPWEGPDDEAESRRLAAIPGFNAPFHFDGGTQKTYAEMVKRLDFQVGRVLDALARLGLAENTVVVFTSDNGGERFSDNWPFSGRKTELLEGGLRIPAIVRWPGRIKPASVSEAQIMSMDWLPTFLTLSGMGADPRQPCDGMDISSALYGMDLPERALFWRYKFNSQEACRLGNWKYLKMRDNTFLFNVVDDPLERANLKNRRPEIFASLRRQWSAWNATMLPYDAQNFTHGFDGSDLADHIGGKDGD